MGAAPDLGPATPFHHDWLCTPAPHRVELTFTALGPALTRVAVEHRGWEALSRRPARARTAPCPAVRRRSLRPGLAPSRRAHPHGGPKRRRPRMKYVLTYDLADGRV